MKVTFLDTETTGFLDPEHRIIEIYADVVDIGSRAVLESYEQRINPKRSIMADAQAVHGIAGSDLLHCPDWEAVGPIVHAMMSKTDMMVAHNAKFDWEFLVQEFNRIGLASPKVQVFCTMENSIWAFPTGKKPSLKELCFAMDVDYDPALAHAAEYDVRKMRECVFKGEEWGWYNLASLDLKSAA